MQYITKPDVVFGVPCYSAAPRPGSHTAEHRRLNDQIAEHVIAVDRLGTFLMQVIGIRNDWRRLANEPDLFTYPPEIRERFGDAAKALGPVIALAVAEQRHREQLANEARGRLVDLEERYAHGTGPCQADAMDERSRALQAAMDRNGDGCCGGTPMEDGVCFGVGKCPRIKEAARCEQFVASYMSWLDQISEQSALAAVAVRLSDGLFPTSEIHNV